MPTPAASSAAVRKRMQTTRRRDTAPELALRREIRSRGLGYRVDAKLPGLRRRADLVFLRATVAVFVDGCFWHRCPEHATRPAANAQWWDDKLTTNQRRDADTDRTLREAGWLVIRIWEHQTQQPADLSAAADAVEAAVLGRRRRTVPVDRAAASS